jgi:small subunit ribosomal protein S21
MVALTQGARAWQPWAGVTASCAAPTVGQSQIGDILLVTVRDNNIDQALKFLKKKMQREGIFREMKLRTAYEKPSERKVREKAEAIRCGRKLARKTAIREGLIAAPKPKTPAPGQRNPAFAQR